MLHELETVLWEKRRPPSGFSPKPLLLDKVTSKYAFSYVGIQLPSLYAQPHLHHLRLHEHAMPEEGEDEGEAE